MNSSWRALHAVCFYIPEKLEPTTCFATLVSTPFLNNLQICNNLQISLCEASQEILFYLENLPVIPTLCFLPFNHKRIKLFFLPLISHHFLLKMEIQSRTCTDLQRMTSWPCMQHIHGGSISNAMPRGAALMQLKADCLLKMQQKIFAVVIK